MYYKSKITELFFLTIIIIIGFSCHTKKYSDDKLNIDPKFLTLFNSVLYKDTIRFKNASGKKKLFVIKSLDSVISNQKGWLINEEPYKLLRMNFREIGTDTTQLERENQIFVNKSPKNNENSLCIKFNNFYYYSDDILPPLILDTLILINTKITNYYLFETSLVLKKPSDVKVLYMNKEKGFAGFKTLSGEIWINEN